MASEIRLEGFDAFKRKLSDLPTKTERVCGAIVQDEAMKWAGLAKRSAPVNFGRLRQGIQAVNIAPLTAEVVSQIRYSPYVEWGTGAKVSVPPDLSDYALRFKGQRQTKGRSPVAFFFIHKPGISVSLNNRINKYLNTEQ